tara:strand:+ start:462 stop:701 length:240 start_codon:yes stop_codon:yes gene_type:complete
MDLLKAEAFVTSKTKIGGGDEMEEIFLLAKYECTDCPEKLEDQEEHPICFICEGKGTYEGIVSGDHVVELLNNIIMRAR